MNEHSEKSANDNARLDFAERAVLLTLTYIRTQKVVNVRDKVFKKDVRDLVIFERGMEHQAQKIAVVFMFIQGL